ncbi:syntaxin-18 [Nilaparvata lugens]|uniref:syntaxin-18 n=1 Tax=Nilaparvata lugens TaxID=108931 RepID=UPI000B990FC1|nr:syntaxin-18 [Nilaparvata lugens]
MDITTLFKACVKTVRMRNKAFGTDLYPANDSFDKNRILRNTNNEFLVRAKDVLGQISRLQEFLKEHRKAYLNFGGHLSDLPSMTDIERDKIDTGAQRIMKTCSNLILDFKRKSAMQDGPPQLLEHQDAALQLIEDFLKDVCKNYSEMKAIRIKRTLETQKMSKLSCAEIPITPGSTNNVRSPSSESISTIDDSRESTSEIASPSTATKRSSIYLSDSGSDLNLQDDQLSAEELQIFENENEQLYNDLNSLNEEVRQIESKVVKIAELQEIFTEKVLEQERDIERIGTTLVGTTENLKDANTHIRKAIESSASLRFYVLFFLLVLSFTLLFLDWYNP